MDASWGRPVLQILRAGRLIFQEGGFYEQERNERMDTLKEKRADCPV